MKITKVKTVIVPSNLIDRSYWIHDLDLTSFNYVANIAYESLPLHSGNVTVYATPATMCYLLNLIGQHQPSAYISNPKFWDPSFATNEVGVYRGMRLREDPRTKNGYFGFYSNREHLVSLEVKSLL